MYVVFVIKEVILVKHIVLLLIHNVLKDKIEKTFADFACLAAHKYSFRNIRTTVK